MADMRIEIRGPSGPICTMNLATRVLPSGQVQAKVPAGIVNDKWLTVQDTHDGPFVLLYGTEAERVQRRIEATTWTPGMVDTEGHRLVGFEYSKHTWRIWARPNGAPWKTRADKPHPFPPDLLDPVTRAWLGR